MGKHIQKLNASRKNLRYSVTYFLLYFSKTKMLELLHYANKIVTEYLIFQNKSFLMGIMQ